MGRIFKKITASVGHFSLLSFLNFNWNKFLDPPKMFIRFSSFSRVSFLYVQAYLPRQPGSSMFNQPCYSLQTDITMEIWKWFRGICWCLFTPSEYYSLKDSDWKFLNASQSSFFDCAKRIHSRNWFWFRATSIIETSRRFFIFLRLVVAWLADEDWVGVPPASQIVFLVPHILA